MHANRSFLALVGLFFLLVALAHGANPPLTNTAAAIPPPPGKPGAPIPSSTNTAAATPPGTNVVANPAPPVPEEYFQRYGKILQMGSEPAHPLKLNWPLPDVGQVRIPNGDEMNMRDKLEVLASLSDDEIRTQLGQWPAFGKMNLNDEGNMFIRIQQFRDMRTRVAMMAAHDLGLNTLTPDQRTKFEKEYWVKRIQMDKDLAKQFQPIMNARNDQFKEELFREFSSPTSSGQPKPPMPVAQAKPGSFAPAALAQKPPAPPPAASSQPPKSETPPVGQAPMQMMQQQ